ncbi:hypothetical protein ISN44_As10g029860 [Arabidopsis suecica]|uniref:F-box family protein n=1 Tax=Arabidopsis suecica TaxID=45249 RepID=A0A8T2A1H1_ARASU|nr:hypothetical protein ISN44_As10g029860 [Arabidopsis suecica]
MAAAYSASTSRYIGHDLVDDILLRLPLKSIIRFNFRLQGRRRFSTVSFPRRGRFTGSLLISGNPNASRIVAFDLHLEEFRVVSHPNPIYSSSDDDDHTPHFSELLVLRDRLSVSEMRTVNVPHARLDIWRMVDVQEESCVKMHSLSLYQLYQPRPKEIQLFTPLEIPDDKGDGGVLIIWYYQESLFMSNPKNFLLNKVSAYARVVASSYFQTLVPVP